MKHKVYFVGQIDFQGNKRSFLMGFVLKPTQSHPCFSLCMFNEAKRSSIVYRDKRSASTLEEKGKEKVAL